jgi:hypothetical protein
MIRVILPYLGTGLLLSLATSLWMVLNLRQGQIAPEPRLGSTDPKISAPETSALVLPVPRPTVYYAAIFERPVFSPTRRPGKTEDEIEEEPQPQQDDLQVEGEQPLAAPNLQLLGTMNNGMRSSALLLPSEGTPAWIAPGDEVEGWTVEVVGKNWIELRQKSQTIRLELYPK